MNRLDWDDQDPDARGRRDGTQMPQQTLFHDLDTPTVLNSVPPREPTEGVLSPLLCAEQWRQMYLGIVRRVCQRILYLYDHPIIFH